jgi:parallel beta-helix repeat protein
VAPSSVSTTARAVWLFLLALLGVALVLAGCTSPPPPPVPPGPAATSAQPPPLPTNCTRTVTQPGDIDAALNVAAAGDTVCFTGNNLARAEVSMMDKSGTATAPITLASAGSAVQNLHVQGNYVIVQGFTVAGGAGLLLEGTGITARQNTVRDTEQGGIGCLPCLDSTIEGNTVSHAASSGIDISGQRITLKGNTVSGTVARTGGDADGVRFGGNGHRITGNTIRDISEKGYSNPPHPDCFQTFDGGAPNFDILISGNTCANVDAQCLIATGDRNSNSGGPRGVSSIVFSDNTCATNGSQAVNLRRWPGVELRQNRFSGPQLDRAILIADGSTGCTVVGNSTANGVPTVEIDESSRPGSHVADNMPS